EKPHRCACSRLRLRKRGLQGEDLHLPDQQKHFAPRNPAGAGPEANRNRQNRSAPEVCFQERPAVFSALKIGKRKSRFRVRRKKAEEERAAQSRRGLTEQQSQALKIVDATTRGVLSSPLTLCVS